MTVTLWNGLAYILKLIGPIVKVLRLVDNEKKLNMGYIYIYMGPWITLKKQFNF